MLELNLGALGQVRSEHLRQRCKCDMARKRHHLRRELIALAVASADKDSAPVRPDDVVNSYRFSAFLAPAWLSVSSAGRAYLR